MCKSMKASITQAGTVQHTGTDTHMHINVHTHIYGYQLIFYLHNKKMLSKGISQMFCIFARPLRFLIFFFCKKMQDNELTSRYYVDFVFRRSADQKLESCVRTYVCA